jgi:aminopeptidase
MDDASCFLGEVAIGTNYNVKRCTKNRSGLHWDMVCDLRHGGEIYMDGELVQKNGKFLNKKFPHL